MYQHDQTNKNLMNIRRNYEPYIIFAKYCGCYEKHKTIEAHNEKNQKNKKIIIIGRKINQKYVE